MFFELLYTLIGIFWELGKKIRETELPTYTHIPPTDTELTVMWVVVILGYVLIL